MSTLTLGQKILASTTLYLDNEIFKLHPTTLVDVFNVSYSKEKQIKLGFTGGAIPNFTIHSLLHKMAYDYLSSDSRKFTHSDILSLEKDYKISYILEGSYSNRLFIPLIEDGIDVNFLTRSVSGDEVRYLNANEQQCIKPLSSCIYGIDELMRIDRGDFLWCRARFGKYGCLTSNGGKIHRGHYSKPNWD
jgi:hypothetical protein